MSQPLYIRPTTQVEPLCNEWYAWPLLVSPATASLFTGFQLQIMESFLEAPQVHRDATKNPAMRGGPFMDYDGDLMLVHEFVRRTKQQLAPTLRFAAGLKLLDAALRTRAKGASLDALYQSIPTELRGYVELGYDLNNSPTVRLIEPLLYRSSYYRPDLQSISFTANACDNRAFAQSTPRLDRESAVRLRVPFASETLATLLAARYSPISATHLDQIIGEHCSDTDARSHLRSMFSSEPPSALSHSPYHGTGMRVRYFGHASIVFESDTVTVMTDPVVSYGDAKGPDRFTFEDLPRKIDYVLLTHTHQDHVHLETLLQIRSKVVNWIVPRSSGGLLHDPSLKLLLEALGFKNVIEIDEFETVSFEGGCITGIPFLGEHGDLNIRSKIGFHILLGNSTFLVLADSRNVDEKIYELTHAAMGSVDAIFIGMECDGAPTSWLYGPLFSNALDRAFDRTRRLNGSDFEQAWDIVQRFNPKSVFVYAMGQEPWLRYICGIVYAPESKPIVESDKLLAACSQRGIHAERLNCKKVVTFE